MNLTTVTLSEIKPYPTNPNTHNDHQIGELAKSLDQFEQVKNIVVWQDFMIAGHGLRQAAMSSGIKELEAVDVSHWPREKAEKFMVADNRLPELGAIDIDTMAIVLAGFDEPLDIPGIDGEWLSDYIVPDFQPTGPNEQPRLDQKSPVICPHCGENIHSE